MSISESFKQRLSRPDPSADPAYAFGAEDVQAAPVRERKTGRNAVRQAGSFFSDLRNRISGGADPSFDDPDYDPDRDAPHPTGYAAPAYGAYAPSQEAYVPQEPPVDYDEESYLPPVQENYDYSYYAAPQPPQPDRGYYGQAPQDAPAYAPPTNGCAEAPADPGEAAFYGGYAPTGAYADFAPAGNEPRQSEGHASPGQICSGRVQPVRPKKSVTARDVGYYFWSFGIVAGMLLTVAAFIYGCVV